MHTFESSIAENLHAYIIYIKCQTSRHPLQISYTLPSNLGQSLQWKEQQIDQDR